MRCWASFAVSVAVLIGQPYHVSASSPAAAQISAASEATSETMNETPSRPTRYSVGDKKVAKKLSDGKVARNLADDKKSSTEKIARHVSDTKVARHVGDDQPAVAASENVAVAENAPAAKFSTPKAAVPQAAMPQAAAPAQEKVVRKLSDESVKRGVADTKVNRKLSDETVKRSVADAKINRSLSDGHPVAVAAPQVVRHEPIRIQAPSQSPTLPGPKPATVEKVAAAPLPKAISPKAITPTVRAPKSEAVSRNIADARVEPRAVDASVESSIPIGSGVAAAPVRRSLSAPVAKVEQVAENKLPLAKPSVTNVTPPKPAPSFAAPAPATVAVAATPPKAIKPIEPQIAKVEPRVKPLEPHVAEMKPAINQTVSSKPAPTFVAPAPAALVAAAKPAVPASPVPAVMPVPVATPAVKETVKASLRESTAAPVQVAAATPKEIVPVPMSRPSTPVRRSFSVQTASQNTPTPAARPAVPQPEPDGDIKSASDAPPAVAAQDHGKTQASIVDGDYCPECEGDADCENCKYGICDLHKDFKVMARSMYQHHPYEAQPWTYYYFRPYNFRHVEAQQQEAAAWGADPNQPYARKMFDKIYADLEKQMAEKDADAEDGK